jgi:hypothetical protein
MSFQNPKSKTHSIFTETLMKPLRNPFLQLITGLSLASSLHAGVLYWDGTRTGNNADGETALGTQH